MLGHFVETALDADQDITTLKIDIYQSYKTFCRANNLSPVSEQSFSRILTNQHGFKCAQMRDENGVKGLILKEQSG